MDIIMYIENLKDQQKSSFYIAKFENAVEDWKEFEKAGINRTAYFAYHKSKASEQELIDFDDCDMRMSKRLSQL
ncbi:MAG: hypothetical protein IJT36_02855 [Alphaproteobacteria bacterium]|nr:hypothetical protein [Alphaproteobacteria bacterium]